MKYQMRDLFSDVIEMAKECGVWQTLTIDEKKTLVEYFLCHFDSLMKELQWHKLSCITTTYVAVGCAPGGRTGGGQR